MQGSHRDEPADRIAAEKALTHVAERLGRAAVHTAISLLPKPLQVPLRAAVHALDRVLDLGLGPVGAWSRGADARPTMPWRRCT